MAFGLVFVLSGFYLMAAGEVFTSMEHTRTLVKTEAAMIEAVNKIIKSEEEKIANLKQLVADLTKLAAAYKAEDLDAISAYKLIRRLDIDWGKVVRILTDKERPYENEYVFDDLKKDHMYPTPEEDVMGSAAAIVRLQEFYTLNTSDIANGRMMDIKSFPLTAAECYDIGWYCFDQWKYTYMKEWLTEARNRLRTERKEGKGDESELRTLEWDIYKLLPRAIFMDGDVHSALKMTEEILHIFPDHIECKHFKKLFEDVIRERGMKDEL